jgi:hypothetical protein
MLVMRARWVGLCWMYCLKVEEGVGVPQFVEFWEFCLKAFTVRAVSQCGQ